MNRQYFEKQTNTVDETDKEENTPVEDPDLSSNKDPALAAFAQQLPAGSVPLPDVDSLDATSMHEAPLGDSIPSDAPTDEPVPHETPAMPKAVSSLSLLDPDELVRLRMRWQEIQGAFVDEPRSAVHQADLLVSEVVEKITQVFANQQSTLESEWKQGDSVSTEDLRQALRHYRSFFNRLVV